MKLYASNMIEKINAIVLKKSAFDEKNVKTASIKNKEKRKEEKKK